MIRTIAAILLSVAFSAHSAQPESSRVVFAFATEAQTLSAFRPLIDLKRDKFETSIEFAKRVCPMTEKAAQVSQGRAAHFAVFGSSVTPYYDPDKKAFLFNIIGAVPGAYESSLSNYLGVPIATSKKQAASYIGENAFGVKRTIVALEEEAVVLLLPLGHRLGYLISTRLQAMPAEARKLDNDLRVVVTTKIQSPCFLVASYRNTPTVSMPEDRVNHLLGVVGSRDASWKIVKISTGEVLKSGKF